MAIQIEILQITNKVKAAFYYPVPPALFQPASVDPSRLPAGTRLSASEIQDLKDGTLYEYIIDEVKPNNVTVAEIQNKLIQLYNSRKSDAATRYTRAYSSDGLAWDGIDWI